MYASRNSSFECRRSQTRNSTSWASAGPCPSNSASGAKPSWNASPTPPHRKMPTASGPNTDPALNIWKRRGRGPGWWSTNPAGTRPRINRGSSSTTRGTRLEPGRNIEVSARVESTKTLLITSSVKEPTEFSKPSPSQSGINSKPCPLTNTSATKRPKKLSPSATTPSTTSTSWSAIGSKLLPARKRKRKSPQLQENQLPASWRRTRNQSKRPRRNATVSSYATRPSKTATTGMAMGKNWTTSPHRKANPKWKPRLSWRVSLRKRPCETFSNRKTKMRTKMLTKRLTEMATKMATWTTTATRRTKNKSSRPQNMKLPKSIQLTPVRIERKPKERNRVTPTTALPARVLIPAPLPISMQRNILFRHLPWRMLLNQNNQPSS